MRIISTCRKEVLRGKGKGVQCTDSSHCDDTAVGVEVNRFCRFLYLSRFILPALKLNKSHRVFQCPSNIFQCSLPGHFLLFEMLCHFLIL